jgi:hypothetical protein
MSARQRQCAGCGIGILDGEFCRQCRRDAERTAPDDPTAAALSLADAIEQLPADAERARYHARQARELLKAHREGQS